MINYCVLFYLRYNSCFVNLYLYKDDARVEYRDNMQICTLVHIIRRMPLEQTVLDDLWNKLCVAYHNKQSRENTVKEIVTNMSMQDSRINDVKRKIKGCPK
jgi:hypothetical protein